MIDSLYVFDSFVHFLPCLAGSVTGAVRLRLFCNSFSVHTPLDGPGIEASGQGPLYSTFSLLSSFGKCCQMPLQISYAFLMAIISVVVISKAFANTRSLWGEELPQICFVGNDDGNIPVSERDFYICASFIFDYYRQCWEKQHIRLCILLLPRRLSFSSFCLFVIHCRHAACD